MLSPVAVLGRDPLPLNEWLFPTEITGSRPTEQVGGSCELRFVEQDGYAVSSRRVRVRVTYSD